MPRNAFYAQSGGVTAVINASAAALIAACQAQPAQIGRIFAGRNGILGALREQLYDAGALDAEALAQLRNAPGGVFGSCRVKLKSLDADAARYQRLLEVFAAHDIGYFFYNGGNDSADTCLKIAQLAEQQGYPLTAIHIPKTVDNDLPHTDCCPGFGSVAKYTAIAIREAALDVASMAETSTKVFILETMGRHAGWIAAAAGLAGDGEQAAPHLILLPEVAFERAAFLAAVRATVARVGYCVIAASEGLRDGGGAFLADSGGRDAFGHAQLGGVAPQLAELIRAELGYKVHWAVADYLQRSARHVASATDLEQAEAVARAAVDFALAGQHGVMPAIRRLADAPYRWRIDAVPLTQIANVERTVPAEFIRQDGLHITDAARRYLQPLIAGEAWPAYRDGLPDYRLPSLRSVPACLPPFLA